MLYHVMWMAYVYCNVRQWEMVYKCSEAMKSVDVLSSKLDKSRREFCHHTESCLSITFKSSHFICTCFCANPALITWGPFSFVQMARKVSYSYMKLPSLHIFRAWYSFDGFWAVKTKHIKGFTQSRKWMREICKNWFWFCFPNLMRTIGPFTLPC